MAAPNPNPDAPSDPAFSRFGEFLLSERNVSPNTWEAYSSDVAQFASFVWGEDARAPFAWASADDSAARAFLDYLTGPEASAVFEAVGFSPLSK